jgi:fibronectin type 3 domain-containing protein
MQRTVKRFSFVVLLVMALLGVSLTPTPAAGATSAMLTRYPYLTDSIQSSITVNWATDRTGATTGSLTWGPVGNCTANTTTATRTSITVISKPEYQWKATIPVTPDTQYCYRVRLGTVDLLGTDPSPTFTSQVAAGSNEPFSFTVFGDWGQAYAGGVNIHQTNLLSQMASSGARFAVMTGDTAYPGGGQTEHGDMQQVGLDQSGVFGPTFWTVPGRSLPIFNVTGNHGFTNGGVQIINWPELNAAATSGGKYAMEPYPSINGSTARNYPSIWYAFNAGNTRFYILTAAWSDSNVGTGSPYQNDYEAHWKPTTEQYQWLKADLEAHPNALKFAFWHYPLYVDSGSQASDTYLQGGASTLQGLLDANNVAIAFNGHAHIYQRNAPDSAGMVSYVLGNGGAALGRVGGCSPNDLYAAGSNGSRCGAAPSGLTDDRVYGFAKVTVNGRQVTVAPTDEMGRTYDVQTYTFPGAESDDTPPTAPDLAATVNSTAKITLDWSGATDNVGVTGYRVFRDGVQLAEMSGAHYVDATVSPDTNYSYTVVALDAAGNVSPPSAPAIVSTTGAPDGTPPSKPGSLTAAAVSSSQVNLSWSASTDNVRVVGYKVYRNGTLLPGPTQPDPNPPTTWSDQTASPGTTYTYEVSAVDAAGNESSKESDSVTTPDASGILTFSPTDDATVDSSQSAVNLGGSSRITVDNSPVNYSLLKFNVNLTSGCSVSSAKLQLTVGSNTNDNSAYGGDVYGASSNSWDESSVNWDTAPLAAGTKVGSVTTAVALNTAYEFDVKPLITGDGPVSMIIKSINSDGARYYSKEGGNPAQDPKLLVTCGSGGGGDTTAPSQPGNLRGTAPSSSRVDFNWDPSTDNVGVTGYRIYRNGSSTPLVSVGGSTTSYSDTSVAAGTTYTYQVGAVDAAGNESSKASVAVTTPSGGGMLTFSPTDDTTVDSSQPTVNFGGSSRITVDNSPTNHALLKFNVSGTAGCSVSSAKLRLTVGSNTSDNSVYGGDVYAASSSSWDESSVNWDTAPLATGTKVGSVTTGVALNTSYLFDVAPLVAGDGTVSMIVKSTSSDGARYYSEEGGTAAQDPQLQVTCR